MRRLFRRSFSGLCQGLCLLSLLACLATAWLWAGQRLRDWPPSSLRLAGTAYTLRADAGGVWLSRPQRALSAAGEARARDMVRLLDNRDVLWKYETPYAALFRGGPWDGPHTLGMDLSMRVYFDAGRLGNPGFPEAAGPLLEALDDPNRFVAAHYMLSCRTGARQDAPVVTRDGRLTASIDGLRVDLGSAPPVMHNSGEVSDGLTISLDPGQIPSLRESWHRRLDVRVASASFPRLTAALAAVPLLWVALRLRRLYVRRRRRRLGLCLRCGYDLTGNASGRCSECGGNIEAVRAGRRMTP